MFCPELPLIIHLKIPGLIPDFFPDVLNFRTRWKIKKKIYIYIYIYIYIFFIHYFNGANCITSNLKVTLKRKNLLPKGANSFL